MITIMTNDTKEKPQKTEPITSLKVGDYTFRDLGTTAVAELQNKEPTPIKRKK